MSRFDLIPDKVDSFAIRKKRVPKVSNSNDRYRPMNPVQRQPQVECLVADIGWHLGSNSARVSKENNSRDPRTCFWPELLDCLANNRGSLTIPCETCQRIEKLKNEEDFQNSTTKNNLFLRALLDSLVHSVYHFLSSAVGTSLDERKGACQAVVPCALNGDGAGNVSLQLPGEPFARESEIAYF